jgi:putative DNA methylase
MTPANLTAPTQRTLADPESGTALSFIEVQFPVSKLSKESYKERKAASHQTLTGLGKWWGRKPLVLCRATILGLLMPASNDPKRDREIFLKLMTMDEDGLWRRKNASIDQGELYRRLPVNVRDAVFNPDTVKYTPRLRAGMKREEKAKLQRTAFDSMSYDEKLAYCCRPEEIDGPANDAWKQINTHFGTKAKSLSELTAELGRRRFGQVPRVGDAFCGGGSVPFEAARLGCDAYGSDLSPVAALLTWAALNIVGGGADVSKAVRKAQREVVDAVERQVTEWGIEHSEKGWRADAFMYCNETRCPECGWMVPLAPSWVVSKAYSCVAKLKPVPKERRFEIEIVCRAKPDDMDRAKKSGTCVHSELICPNENCGKSTPIKSIRGDRSDGNALRRWTKRDVLPLPDDVFQERLFCIRWVAPPQDGAAAEKYFYLAPDEADHDREAKALSLLSERFETWQANGWIPNRVLEPGEKTNEPIRARGWSYWHHLFTPRQLLTLGALAEHADRHDLPDYCKAGFFLGLSRCADYNSRLSRWHPRGGRDGDIIEDTFSGQALKVLISFASSSSHNFSSTFVTKFSKTVKVTSIQGHTIAPADCRSVQTDCDLWITDPPYADAINYHELSEFFLAWYGTRLQALFDGWTADSKRALAIKGTEESFRQAMVECYQNLAAHMPEGGMQVVMFTHQDAAVWADLALILWAAGLRVTAAWCIQTETESDLKQGNYVQGTVLLVLRKQTSTETRFLDEVYQDVEVEVRRQLDAMLALDDKEDPNFGEPDYQLAAYAAALRVLTDRPIEEIDVFRELSRARAPGETSPIVELIENAVRIACDHLVPRGLDKHMWKSLSGLERFYLKGLELEAHGENRVGAYQDLARGFRARDYDNLLASNKANEARLKTAGEFGRRDLGSTGFGSTLVRHCLFAAHKTRESEGTRDGLTWLKDRENVPDYWGNRERIVKILNYLASLSHVSTMPHWHADAHAAGLLAGAVHNDHV